MFSERIIGLPYTGTVTNCIIDNTDKAMVEEIRSSEMFLLISHNRIAAMITNTTIAPPEITIKAIGETEFPVKSVAEDSTDKI